MCSEGRDDLTIRGRIFRGGGPEPLRPALSRPRVSDTCSVVGALHIGLPWCGRRWDPSGDSSRRRCRRCGLGTTRCRRCRATSTR